MSYSGFVKVFLWISSLPSGTNWVVVILPLFSGLHLRSVPNDVRTRYLGVSVGPIREVSFCVFMLRPRICFTVVVSYRVGRRAPILVFGGVVRVAKVRRSASPKTGRLFRLLGRDYRVFRLPSGTQSIRRRRSYVRYF